MTQPSDSGTALGRDCRSVEKRIWPSHVLGCTDRSPNPVACTGADRSLGSKPRLRVAELLQRHPIGGIWNPGGSFCPSHHWSRSSMTTLHSATPCEGC